MVKTRVVIVPTTTPAIKTVPEPIVGVIARGVVVMKGRGRGCGRKTNRGRGQATRPARDKAMTPPLIDEVAREGDEVEDEQIHEKEALPQSTLEMINQVLTYLSRLSNQAKHP
ncbi:hypothetical protein KY284_001256 [Solanum tuberosum]|nr:hypothetical protein KY284_001256 [Solanum tuberosum]